MFPKDTAKLCVFYTITPLHAGSGQAISAVDLPIQRERHTQWPQVQASGVKGAFRDWFRRYYENNEVSCSDKFKQAEELTNKIFGKEEGGLTEIGEKIDGQSGAVAVTDARILFFPVRSNVAPFVWVTCPAVLARLKRDLALCSIGQEIPAAPDTADSQYKVINGTFRGSVVLEDLALLPDEQFQDKQFSDLCLKLAPQVTRLLLISDKDFSFLVRTATEIQPQIKIDLETGTASGGSLRYQEFLPSDSILYSLVFFARERISGNGLLPDVIQKCVTNAISSHIQMGGDMTTGRGLMEVRWLPEDGKGGSK